MSTMTIRNIEDGVKQALRERAAKRGVSMEQEVRAILKEAVLAGEGDTTVAREDNWYRAFRKQVEQYGGFDLEIPPRSKSMREPPSFE